MVIDGGYQQSGGGLLNVMGRDGTTIAHLTLRRARYHLVHVTGGPRGPSTNTRLFDLHLVDPGEVPDASLGPDGMASVFSYWRASLLDVLAPEAAPRQLALLGWLQEHLPPGADDDPAPCMGDARMVNCLVEGTTVRGLVDFEIAYLGDPAADIGYSLFLDGQSRSNAEHPLPGIPGEDETWARWESATGRTVPEAERRYWKAFGAMILAVTATRLGHRLANGAQPPMLIRFFEQTR